MASASPAACFCASANSFRSASRSSASLDPAPSVPSPTATPARRAAGIGEHGSDRQLHVRGRVGHHGGPPLCDQLHLRVVEPDAVGQDRPLAEKPAGVEVGGRASSRARRRSRGPPPRSRRDGSGSAASPRPPARRSSAATPRRRCRSHAEQATGPRRRRMPARASIVPSAASRRSPPSMPDSISGPPITARSPASQAARAVSAGCQYMSQKRAVPVRAISRQASRAPQ